MELVQKLRIKTASEGLTRVIQQRSFNILKP